MSIIYIFYCFYIILFILLTYYPVFDADDNFLFKSHLHLVTDNLEQAVLDAEIIFVTFPAEMFRVIAKKLLPFVKPNQKISGISAFKGIKTPMVQVSGGWIPDFSSRCFTSDFCFGFKIIKDIAALFELKTPNIDSVWDWYCATAPKNTQIHDFKLNLTADEFVALYK